MGRNLEDLARNNDLMTELSNKQTRVESLQKYVDSLKMVSHFVCVCDFNNGKLYSIIFRLENN